ncbi:MAG: ATP-dependent DNA helicase [Candidatus Micrarchaeota archaeon]
MEVYFRHGRMRKYQDEMVNDILRALEERKHILCHAPLGCGKTDAALSAALTHALNNDLSVIFLTPKISQHKIALEVLRGIRAKFNLDFVAVDVVGRRHTCPEISLDELDYDDFYRMCERKRKGENCIYYANARGFSRQQERKAGANFEKIKGRCGPIFDSSEVCRACRETEACPYEMSMRAAPGARVLIADYFQLLAPRVRKVFLARTRKELGECVVIVDEAHNAAGRLREQLSSSINSFILRKAAHEARMLGSEFDVGECARNFEKWCKGELKNENEILVGKDDIKNIFENMESAYISLEDLGTEYIEKTNKRSACLRISRFLEKWDEEEGFVRILRKRGKWFTLKHKCLDPARATALNEASSAILMSGTLVPLEMHRDLLGLEPGRTIMKEYPSPFPRENRLNLVVPGVTTRYSKRTREEFERIAHVIEKVISATPGNVGVFFPAYNVLQSILPLMNLGERVFVQKERMKAREVGELLENFKRAKEKGGVLVGVQGGSVAEGIDLPNREMLCAVIVGVALEEMSIEVEALIDYYDEKFGKGWEYGYMYPAVSKALQAAGRCVRSESDRAVVVFVDDRFKWKNYACCFPKDFERIVTAEPEEYARSFWRSRE